MPHKFSGGTKRCALADELGDGARKLINLQVNNSLQCGNKMCSRMQTQAHTSAEYLLSRN